MNYLSSSQPPIIDSVIVQGDSYLFTLEVPDYPNAIWAGQLTFTSFGLPPVIVAAAPDPANVNGYLALLDTAASLTLPVGFVDTFLVLTEASPATPPPRRTALELGSLSVAPNPLVQYQPNTPNQIALVAVNATIATILSQPESSASFNGQSYTLHNIKDLFDIRNSLQVQVAGELRSVGLVTKPTSRIIQNRFV